MRNWSRTRLLFVGALMLLFLAGTCVAASLSNSGGEAWKYQRDINIRENSGTMLTDYQVLIDLKGADFPNEAENDGADVRFTDSSGNELNYWIESWDYSGKNAKIWVKIPSISAVSSTVIRMLYGNPSATMNSNGNKVFDFFGDDASKFISDGIGSFSVRNNIITTVVTGGTHPFVVRSNVNFLDFIAESDGRFTSTNAVPHMILYGRYTNYNVKHFIECPIRGTMNDLYVYEGTEKGNIAYEDLAGQANAWHFLRMKVKGNTVEFYANNLNTGIEGTTTVTISTTSSGGAGVGVWQPTTTAEYKNFRVRKYASSEPTITLAPLKSSSISITKSASPYSLRQFQESTIKVTIENSGASEIKTIEIMDSIHPSFDLTGGDFPNPKKFTSIRAGEARELQYIIKSKETGTFTFDPATVTYADSEGNIQEAKSEPVSIKVVPSSITTPDSVQTSSPECPTSSAVLLHGEKTDVVLGEDILLKLSAVNLITKPPMSVQVMIYPPSGMSVTSSEFIKSGAGIYTTTYTLNPGDGKDIEVHIKTNQVGDFNAKGRIVYYFGEDKNKAEDCTLNLPIKVRKEPTLAPTSATIPGFEAIISICSILLISFLRKKL